jgi:hypothetical protein
MNLFENELEKGKNKDQRKTCRERPRRQVI